MPGELLTGVPLQLCPENCLSLSPFTHGACVLMATRAILVLDGIFQGDSRLAVDNMEIGLFQVLCSDFHLLT